LDEEDKDDTPLATALQRGHDAIAKILREAGAAK